MTIQSETHDQPSREQVPHETSKAEAHPRRGGAPKAIGRQSRRTLKEAEAAIISAWRIWSMTNLTSKSIGDEDVHAFLRHARAEAPDLLSFSSRTTPYETAFGWIVGDHAGLQPMRYRPGAR